MYTFLVIGALMVIFPFIWMISTSLMTFGETATRRWFPGVPQFINYAQAWHQGKFSKYFLNSVIIACVTVSGQLFTSILAGYCLARIRFRGRNLIFALLLSTMMVPAMVVMIPNFMVIQDVFVHCRPRQAVSFRTAIFGSSGSWLNSLIGITLPSMVSVFSIFLLRQFLAQIPWELWDAAPHRRSRPYPLSCSGGSP